MTVPIPRAGRSLVCLFVLFVVTLFSAAAVAGEEPPDAHEQTGDTCYTIDVTRVPDYLVIHADTGKVHLGDQALNLPVAPRRQQGRVLVPVHAFAALAGVPVHYEPDGHRFVLERDQSPVVIALAGGQVWIDDEPAGEVAVGMDGAVALVDVVPLAEWLGASLDEDEPAGTMTLSGNWIDLRVSLPREVRGPGLAVCVGYPSDWYVGWEVAEMPQVLGAERRIDPERTVYRFTAERGWVDLAPGANTLTLRARHQHVGELVRAFIVRAGAGPSDYPIAYGDWTYTPAPDHLRPAAGEVQVLAPTSGYTWADGPLTIRGEIDRRLDYHFVTLEIRRLDDPGASHRAELPLTDGAFTHELEPLLGPGPYQVSIYSPPVITAPRRLAAAWLARFVVQFAPADEIPAPGEGEISVMVDGRQLGSDVPPRLDKGRVLVPWRGLLEYYGFAVDYDAETRRIVTTGEGRRIELQVGSAAASVNDEPVTLDVPAQVVDGRTLVPLRFVSEALGYTVDWADATRTVIISGHGEPASPLPALAFADIRTVQRIAARDDPNRYRTLSSGDPADRKQLTAVVAAWQTAVPAAHPAMDLPTPYGASVRIETAGGPVVVHVAWACADREDGTRFCRYNDQGYVYLRVGDGERVLVQAPGLVRFILDYPIAE